jgi:hypothetical protein
MFDLLLSLLLLLLLQMRWLRVPLLLQLAAVEEKLGKTPPLAWKTTTKATAMEDLAWMTTTRTTPPPPSTRASVDSDEGLSDEDDDDDLPGLGTD